MLYRFTTTADLSRITFEFPIFKELEKKLRLIEENELNAYILLAENIEDLQEVKNVIDFETHLCEWAEYADKAQQYVTAVYQLNNDFGVDLYLPISIAPDVIKEEL